jgi:hypothetical protein
VDRLRTSVALPWVIAVIGFPIGGLLAQTIAGPAATVPTAILSGLIAGAIVGPALAPGWPVYGASGALVSQIITAVALWRLVPSGDALRAGA